MDLAEQRARAKEIRQEVGAMIEPPPFSSVEKCYEGYCASPAIPVMAMCGANMETAGKLLTYAIASLFIANTEPTEG